MALHDRDYMQGTSGAVRTWLGALSATGWLIAINLVVFLTWQVGPAALLSEHFTVSAHGLLREGRVWTLVTSGFSHSGLVHLLFNMLFLYWFAADLEAIYGRANLVALYLLAAVGCALAQVGLFLASGDSYARALGASGAVMAVVVASALFHPHRRVHIWGILPVPLWGLAAFFVVSDLLGVAREVGGGSSGIAHAGHLGGALVGVLFQRFDLRPFPGPDGGRSRLARLFRRGPRLRVLPGGPREPASPPPPPPAGDPDVALRVDELLRKINRDGLGSLTPEERRFLEEASATYRQR